MDIPRLKTSLLAQIVKCRLEKFDLTMASYIHLYCVESMYMYVSAYGYTVLDIETIKTANLTKDTHVQRKSFKPTKMCSRQMFLPTELPRQLSLLGTHTQSKTQQVNT